MNRNNIILLYLFLATADHDFSSSEQEFILQKIKALPGYYESETDSLWEEAFKFMKQNQRESLDGFLQKLLMNHTLTEAELHEIIQNMEGIIESDGVVNMEELTFYQKARHYLIFSALMARQARA